MRSVKIILILVFTIFTSSMYAVDKFTAAYNKEDMLFLCFICNLVVIVFAALLCIYKVTVMVKPWVR